VNKREQRFTVTGIEHRTGIGAYGAPKINQAKTPPPGTPLTMTISRPIAAQESATP